MVKQSYSNLDYELQQLKALEEQIEKSWSKLEETYSNLEKAWNELKEIEVEL